ncbi:hypothetical protein F5Y03DRAFT_408189 [Xylaria venustula]|nr:hypothetical protein F5Y03DRAFT_408189 [Xylaria venustula]
MSGRIPFARRVSTQARGKFCLAVLEPACEQDTPISLTLVHVDLQDTYYECISYDRVRNTSIAKVSINGEDYEIPQVLESALRNFRCKEKPRTLWADLLAGRTAEERGGHTATMRKILENADKTLYWLGPERELTSRAFDMIHDMANQYRQASVQVDLSQGPHPIYPTKEHRDGIEAKLKEMKFTDLVGRYGGTWNELHNIFGLSHWRSVQCIAEIVLANSPVIVCGSRTIRWPNFVDGVRALECSKLKYNMQTWAYSAINQIDILRGYRRVKKPLELDHLLKSAQYFEAHDPRDYVFSMIMISEHSWRVKCHNAGPQPLPPINYTKSTQEVFIDAARHIVLERQDLMIWLCERPPCTKRVKGLPTWVPDFSSKLPWEYQLFNGFYGLSGWWNTVKPRKNIRISDGNALLVQAYALDRVEYVSDIFDNGNLSSLCYKEWKKLLVPCKETREQRNMRFWRTLILNRDTILNGSGANVLPSVAVCQGLHSLLCEQALCKQFGCDPSQIRSPEVLARIEARPAMKTIFQKCGKSERYVTLLRTQSLGRRFFITEGGRFGMTAIEDVVAANPNMTAQELKLHKLGNNGDRQSATRASDDPMARTMAGEYQNLQQQTPVQANASAQTEAVKQSAQQEDCLKEHAGVTKGDIVVALVGGNYPYIVRPQLKATSAIDESSSQRFVSDSAYEFVGQCYLHGSMNGEDFIFNQKTS